MSVHTDDGVALHGLVYDRDRGDSPPSPAGGVVGIVVCHGVTQSSQRPEVQEISRTFAAYGTVLSIDHRGHGRSGGRSTVGDREVLDVDAAVGWLRDHGCTTVVTTGWSMGAGAVLRHEALVGEELHGHPLRHHADAIVHVSGTSRWLARDTRRTRWMLTMMRVRRPGHLVARRMGVRLEWPMWQTFPLMPVEAAARLGVRWRTGDRPVPLLVVHGSDDGYFAAGHADALAEAAGEAAEVWIEDGFGHAEVGIVTHPDLLARLGSRLPELIGRIPR